MFLISRVILRVSEPSSRPPLVVFSAAAVDIVSFGAEMSGILERRGVKGVKGGCLYRGKF
jgi:hypothetical protein